mgnify:FL=1
MDAILILVLWCLRTSSLLLLFLGWILLAANHRTSDPHLAAQIDSPSDITRSLTTPLAGVALAIVVRGAAAALAWLSAARLVTQEDPPLVPPQGQARWRRLTDHWRQITAAAAIRGTWRVLAAAVAEAGVWGPRLRMADIFLRILSGVSLVAAIIVLLMVN